MTSSRRGGPSNWVDRGESVEHPLSRILSVVFHRDPLEHGVWLAEHARAVFGMVAADATEVAVAGYLNGLARELALEPGEIKARSTAAALWHVAKVALLREELVRFRTALGPQTLAEPLALNEAMAAALLNRMELERYHRERKSEAAEDDASR